LEKKGRGDGTLNGMESKNFTNFCSGDKNSGEQVTNWISPKKRSVSSPKTIPINPKKSV
jgi:hypothetical protein